MILLEDFKEYLIEDSKSNNTINSYLTHIKQYLNWFKDTYDTSFSKLYRANILEYISYLRNIKRQNAKTVNAKLSALIKLNDYLIDKKIQDNIVLSKKDKIKMQMNTASPTEINKQDVESFRQRILENDNIRNYTIITLLAYTGVRISECLDIKMNDFNLVTRELIIRAGKGDKQRIVYLNDKCIGAINEYLKERNSDSEYLFVSNRDNKVDRTVINRVFNKYSDKITPHSLRHFFCTRAIESGYSIHEVASFAGHSNIHTTLIYTNPTKEEMKRKANLL